MQNRRKFLKNMALTTISLSAIPSLAKGFSNNSSLQSASCNPTTQDYYGEGPFYTAGAPFLASNNFLANENEPGERLVISGVVRNLDCTEVIPNATIDLWHADHSGAYDNSGGYHLRGKTSSNSSGHYIFETIKPGKYLNGANYRPSHIHVKISAPGFPVLTTQIYFTGDTSIPADAAASINSGAYDATHRTVDLTMLDGKWHGNWDIVINADGVNTASMESLHLENGMLYNISPNPFQEEVKIEYGVFKDANVSIQITDVKGNVVAMLKDEPHTAEKYTAIWQPSSYLPDGYYFAIIKINDIQVHHLKIMRQASGY